MLPRAGIDIIIIDYDDYEIDLINFKQYIFSVYLFCKISYLCGMSHIVVDLGNFIIQRPTIFGYYKKVGRGCDELG